MEASRQWPESWRGGRRAGLIACAGVTRLFEKVYHPGRPDLAYCVRHPSLDRHFRLSEATPPGSAARIRHPAGAHSEGALASIYTPRKVKVAVRRQLGITE